MRFFEETYEFPLGSGNTRRNVIQAETEEQARLRANTANPTLTLTEIKAPLPVRRKGPLTAEGEYKMPDHQRAYVGDLINSAYRRDVITTKTEARTLTGARLTEQQDKAKQFLQDNPGFFSHPGDGSLVDDLVTRKGVISIQLAWELWRWSSYDIEAMQEVMKRQGERAVEREKAEAEAVKAAGA